MQQQEFIGEQLPSSFAFVTFTARQLGRYGSARAIADLRIRSSGRAVEGRVEIVDLVALQAQPGAPVVGEHGIEHHQACDQAAQGGRLAMPVVGLADSFLQRA
ncbi:MAG: hypothetical protein R2712_00170 [Vicinamibacterales bacterium]